MAESTREDKDFRPGSVGELIDFVACAFEQTPSWVIDEIIKTGMPPRGDSDPTRETMKNYLRPAVRTPVSRGNRDTPLHLKFAHLTLNYLEGRRPDGKVIQVPETLAANPNWKEARKRCIAVLRKERDRRYTRFLGGDSGKRGRVAALVGAYAVSRRESSDAGYHQELLVLSNRGTALPKCYCTYVTPTVVMRGEWMFFGDMLYCHMSGIGENNTHDMCAVYLSYSGAADLLTGFLAGPGTQGKYPVAMPVVVARIPKPNPEVHELGDLGDTAVLSAMRELALNLDGVKDTLSAFLEGYMAPVAFGPSDCVPDLRARFPGGQGLVSPQLIQFCRDLARWSSQGRACTGAGADDRDPDVRAG